MKKIAHALILLLTCQFANAQWSQVNIPGNFAFNGVHLLNSTNYFMGSYLLSESNNGGSIWSHHPIISATDGVEIWGGVIEDVHFFDANTGVVAGYFLFGGVGYILRTTDGGATWDVVSEHDQGNFPFGFNDMHFIPNTEIGYAVGTNGTLLKTIDSGLTWSQQFTGTTNNLYGIHFVDANNGFAVGDNLFLKTTNGGTSWSQPAVPFLPERVFFIDSQTGYIGGGGLLQKTTDGGSTWQDVSLTLPTGLFYVRDIYFSDANTGYVLTSDYILKTDNGGLLWEYQSLSSGGTKCSRFDWLNPSVALISGGNGVCWKTTNGGGNYKPIAKFETVGGATDFCAGVSYPLNNLTQASTNYTYSWYLNGVLFSTAVSPNVIFPAGSTVYEIKLVVNNGLASDTYLQNVNTYPEIQPYSPDFYATATTICQGESFVLNGNNLQQGTSNIDWQLLANGQPTALGGYIFSLNEFLTPDITTTYTLMGTYTWYCDSMPIIAEVTVEVVPLGLPVDVQIGDSTLCAGDSTQVFIYNSVQGVQYQLFSSCYSQPLIQMGNGGTLTFPSGTSNFQGCDYYLVTRNGNCFKDFGEVVDFFILYPVAGMNEFSYQTLAGQPVQFGNISYGASEYNWDFGSGAIPPNSNDFNPTVTYPTPGVYDVTLKAIDENCSNILEANMEVFPADSLPALNGSFCVDTLTDLSYFGQLNGDKILDVAMGADGNIYVTGYQPDNSVWNSINRIFIRKYDTTGNLLFSKHVPASDHPGLNFKASYGNAIAADADGNIYLGGSFYGDAFSLGGQILYQEGMSWSGSKPHGFVAKLDPQGNMMWHLLFASRNEFTPIGPSDIIWGNDGRIIVSIKGFLTFVTNKNGERLDEIFEPRILSMLQLNTDGIIVALHPVMFGYTLDSDYYNSNLEGPEYYDNTVGGPRMELMKNGNLIISGEIWRQVYVGQLDFGYELIPRTAFSKDNYVVVANLNGEVQSYFSPYGYVDFSFRDQYFQRFAVDDEGNIYLSVSLRSGQHAPIEEFSSYLMVEDSTRELGGDKHFLLKYSPQGELLWKLRNGSLDVDQLAFLDGKIYGLARYDGFLGLNSTNGDKFSLPAQGSQDLALVAWTPDGEPLGALPMSSPNYDMPFFMLNDGCGKLVSLFVKDLPIPFVAPTFTHIATYAPDSDCMPVCPLTCILPPQTTPFCIGEEAHLYMGATGESLNYQWQQLQGGSYIDIADGAAYSGANAATLTISADQAPSLVNEMYRCIVTDSSAAQIITDGAKIVSVTPTVTALFDSVTLFQLIPSISITLEAEATGELLSYQWQVFTNGEWINMNSGIGNYQTYGDSLILNFPNPSFEGLGFRCVVTSGFGCKVISETTFLHAISPTNEASANSWGFSLHPNPTDRTTNIKLDGQNSEWNWTLTDGLGKTLRVGQAPAGTSSATINMEALATGIYWVRVKSGEQVLVKRVVKERF